MATSFSGGGSRSTRRKPPTLGKQLLNFITCGCFTKRARTHAVVVIGFVWAVRSNDVANWATRAPCNCYISIGKHGILQQNSIYIFTHYLYEYNFGHKTLEYELVTSTTQSYFQNTIICLNTELCFAGFLIIITYDFRTLNFDSVRFHLLSAIPLKTVSQMQKHPCKLADIPVQKGLHLSEVWPFTF